METWVWLALIVGLVALLIQIGKLLRRGPKPITSFEGKHVVITGGSTGLGKALALKFLQLGSKVTIIARNVATLEKTREELKQAVPNRKILALPCDVTDWEKIQRTATATISEMGVPDLLIPNAGLSSPYYFVDNTPQNMEMEMKVNYFGTVYTIKAFLPSMIERGKGGHITIISSAGVFAPCIGFANYIASKMALKGLAASLRNELLLYDIGVSGFYPGSIDTEGFAQENITKPKETKEIEGKTSLQKPSECADTLIAGLKAGHFCITSKAYPDDVIRLLSHGFTVRDKPLLDLLLTPLFLLLSPIFVYTDLDSVVLKGKKNLRKNQ